MERNHSLKQKHICMSMAKNHPIEQNTYIHGTVIRAPNTGNHSTIQHKKSLYLANK